MTGGQAQHYATRPVRRSLSLGEARAQNIAQNFGPSFGHTQAATIVIPTTNATYASVQKIHVRARGSSICSVLRFGERKSCTAIYQRRRRRQLIKLPHSGAIQELLPHLRVKIGTGLPPWHGLCLAPRTLAKSCTTSPAIQSAHAEPTSRKSAIAGAHRHSIFSASSFTARKASRSCSPSWPAVHGGSNCNWSAASGRLQSEK